MENVDALVFTDAFGTLEWSVFFINKMYLISLVLEIKHEIKRKMK